MANYYRLLGVKKNASYSQIIAAFRDRLNELLPDIAGMDEGAMGQLEEIRKAYDALSDPDSRREHDGRKNLEPKEYIEEREEALKAHLDVLKDGSIDEKFRVFIGSRILEKFRQMVSLEAIFCNEDIPEKVRKAAVLKMESESEEMADCHDLNAMQDPLSGYICRPYRSLSDETLNIMVYSDFLPERIRLSAGLSLAARFFNDNHKEGLEWIMKQDPYPKKVKERAAQFLEKMERMEAAKRRAPASETTAPIELRRLKPKR